MKRRNRQRYLLNLLSLVLLAIALYLNFIKKDTADAFMQVENGRKPAPPQSNVKSQTIPVHHTAQMFVLK